MNYVIALDLQGLLVELRNNFDSYTKARQYLHDNYKSFKDLKPYIIEYDGDRAIYGSPYKFNVSTYYACEDGIYHKEHYDEIDQGQGLKEIGSTYLVNIDLLPLPLKNDGELVELAINKWFNSMDNSIPKPIWLL